MKKFMILIGWMLSFIRYHNKPNAFKSFKKIKKYNLSRSNNPKNDERVLVLPINVSPTSSLFEGLMSEFLSAKGYGVYCLLENGELEYSEYSNVTKNNFVTRCLSLYEQKCFINTFNVQPVYYQKTDTFIDISSMSLDKAYQLKYRGIEVGKHAMYGVMRYLMISELNENHAWLFQKFLNTSISTVEAVENAIKETRPSYALISHGCYSTWGTALETLKKHNVKTRVWGRGYVGKGSLIISNDESYLLSRIRDNRHVWERSELSDKNIEELISYYREKSNPKSKVDFVNYYEGNQSDDNSFSFLKEQTMSYKRIVGVYPNIPWDGTMYSSSEAFPTARSFAAFIKNAALELMDTCFIVRCHPAEKARKGNISQQTFNDLLLELEIDEIENVIILESDSTISSYDVASISNSALMYGSTLALEFLMNRHTVIQLGRSNVSNKGLLMEPNSVKEAIECLKSDHVISDKEYSMIVKYANYWVNNNHQEDPVVELDKLSFSKFKFGCYNEFLNNNDFKALSEKIVNIHQ